MALNYSPYNPSQNYSPYVPTPVKKKEERQYVRYAGSPIVYEKGTGRYVPYAEAVTKNIWSKVEDVNMPDPHKISQLMPNVVTPQTTVPQPTAQTTPAFIKPKPAPMEFQVGAGLGVDEKQKAYDTLRQTAANTPAIKTSTIKNPFTIPVQPLPQTPRQVLFNTPTPKIEPQNVMPSIGETKTTTPSVMASVEGTQKPYTPIDEAIRQAVFKSPFGFPAKALNEYLTKGILPWNTWKNDKKKEDATITEVVNTLKGNLISQGQNDTIAEGRAIQSIMGKTFRAIIKKKDGTYTQGPFMSWETGMKMMGPGDILKNFAEIANKSESANAFSDALSKNTGFTAKELDAGFKGFGLGGTKSFWQTVTGKSTDIVQGVIDNAITKTNIPRVFKNINVPDITVSAKSVAEAANLIKKNSNYYQSTGGFTAGTENANAGLRDLDAVLKTNAGKQVARNMISEAVASKELPVQKNGEVVLYRAGTISDKNPLVSFTYDKQVADNFKGETGNKGKDMPIYQISVKPSDISLIIKGNEKEVLLSKDLPQVSKLSDNAWIDDIFAKAEQPIDSVLPARPVTKIKQSIEDAESQVWQQLDTASAGKRVFNPSQQAGLDFNITSQPSTFPEWIPKELRKTPIVEEVKNAMVEGVVPTTAPARQLYNIARQQIATNAGVTAKELASMSKPREQYIVKINMNKLREALARPYQPKGILTERKMGLTPPPARMITKPENVLLSDRLRAMQRGSRYGYQAGKTETRKAMIDKYKNKEATIGQLKSDLVEYANQNMPPSIRGKVLARVKSVKTDLNLSRAMEYIDRMVEKHDQKTLRSLIIKELKKSKPSISSGIPHGRYTADVQKQLDFLRLNLNTDRAEARTKIADNIEQYSNGTMSYEDMRSANDKLGMVGINGMTSNELRTVLDNIKSLKTYGRTINKEKQLADEDRISKLREDLLKVITGGKGLKPGWVGAPPESIRPQISNISEGTDKFMNWQLGWDNFMDKLSKFNKESAPYKSSLSTFGNIVHDSRKLEEGGRLDMFKKLQDMANNVFKPKSKHDLLNTFSKMENSVRSLGKFKNLRGEEVNLKMTGEQLIKKYQELQDPTLRTTFKETMGYTDDMMTAINNSLTEKEKAWANAQLDFYKEYYPKINDVFREVYGVDLPFNPNYSPISRDVESQMPEDILLTKEGMTYASAISRSLKSRVPSNISLKYIDSTPTLVNHIIKMEHFKAWADTLKDLRRVFGNKEIRAAIEQYHGKNILKHVDKLIGQMATGGTDLALTVHGIDVLRKNFAKSILAIKPIIALKQTPSILAYMVHVSPSQMLSGMLDFWKNPIKNYRTLMQSPYYRGRLAEGFERDIRLAMKQNPIKIISKVHNFTDMFMAMIRLGDQFAVVQGSWAVYKAGGKTPEALKQAEWVTNQTQPTDAVETLASPQRGGSWARLFTMFQNEPNKYFRIAGDALRNLKRGRGSKWGNIKALLITMIVLPTVFQWIADGFKWNTKRQAAVIALGPLQNILIFGSFIQTVAGWITEGQTYDLDISPVASTFTKDLVNTFNKMIGMWKKGIDEIDSEDVIKLVEYMSLFVGKLTGLPTPYAVQVERAFREGNPKGLIFTPYMLGENNKEEQPKNASDILNNLKKKYNIQTPGSSSSRTDMLNELKKKYNLK